MNVTEENANKMSNKTILAVLSILLFALATIPALGGVNAVSSGAV